MLHDEAKAMYERDWKEKHIAKLQAVEQNWHDYKAPRMAGGELDETALRN